MWPVKDFEDYLIYSLIVFAVKIATTHAEIDNKRLQLTQ